MFCLKFALQRGEAEKREGVQISKTKHPEPFTQEIPSALYSYIKHSLDLQDVVDVKENIAGTRVGGKSF